MTEQEQWLETIRQSPTDIALQRVYSDWLEERGREEEAKLIRILCDFHERCPQFIEDEKMKPADRMVMLRDWLPGPTRTKLRQFLSQLDAKKILSTTDAGCVFGTRTTTTTGYCCPCVTSSGREGLRTLVGQFRLGMIRNVRTTWAEWTERSGLTDWLATSQPIETLWLSNFGQISSLTTKSGNRSVHSAYQVSFGEGRSRDEFFAEVLKEEIDEVVRDFSTKKIVRGLEVTVIEWRHEDFDKSMCFREFITASAAVLWKKKQIEREGRCE